MQTQSIVHLVTGFGGLLYFIGLHFGMRYSGPAGAMRGNVRDGVVMVALILTLPIVDFVVTAGNLSRWFYYGAYAVVLVVLLLFAVRVYRRSTAKPASSEGPAV
ncbi:hypothetical protein AB0C02_28650 [Micromonospora sp. NPDC048999]|uniref:hypothetical protein n=1 Tax=Micromonospora sp. NPDC048999 TaxID=3155391 RepID=UPI0033D3A3A6